MELHEIRELVIKHRVRLSIAFGTLVVLAFAVALILRTGRSQPIPPGEEEIAFPEWSQDLGAPAQGLEKLEKLFQQVPQDFNVYDRSETAGSYSETEAAALATKLGFSQQDYSKLGAGSGTIYAFEKSGKQLTVEASPPSISYSFNSQNLRRGVVPSESSAASAARTFLGNLGFSELNYLLGSYKLVFSDGEHLTTSLDKSQANLVEVSFNYLRDGYPIVSSSPSKYAAVATLDSKRTIVSLQIRELNVAFDNPRVVQSKPFETAIEEIGSGNGSVIYVEGLVGEEIVLGDIALSAFSPAKVFLAYYVDETELIAPVYVFKGEGTLSRGGEVWATVYLPATE